MADNGLTFRFSADTGGAQRAIQNLAGSAGRNLAVLAGSAVLASRNVEAINGSARRAGEGLADLGRWVSNHRANIGTVVRLYSLWKVAQFGVIASAAALAAATAGANKALEEMAGILKGAEAAGVSTGFFQTFLQQAAKVEAKADDLAAALKKAKEATELTVNDKGERQVSRPVQILRNIEEEVPQIGPLADGINNSPYAEGRIVAALQAIKEVRAEAERIGSEDLRLQINRFAEAMFGAVGPKLADALAENRASVDDFSKRLGEAGRVYDEALIYRSKQVQAELDAANGRLKNEMIPAMQSLASTALALKSGWADIVSLIAAAVKNANDLSGRVGGLAKLLGTINPLINIGAQFESARGLPRAIRDVVDPPPPPYGDLRDVPSAFVPSDKRLAAWWRNRNWKILGDAGQIPKASGSKDASGADTPDAVERYVKQAERAIRLLEAEAAALGKTRVERTIALELAKAENAAKERGTPLTEAELANINRLAAARGNLTEQIRKQREAEAAVRRASEFIGQQTLNALRDIIVAGEDAEDVMKRLGIAILNAALQASLFGGGPLGKLGLFNSFGEGGIIGALGKGFAGLFASGGYIPAGQWGIAGEAGPEIVTGPANVIPPMRAGGMALGGVTVKNYGEAGLVSVHRVNDMIEVRVAEAFRYTDTRVAASDRTTFARVQEQNARRV